MEPRAFVVSIINSVQFGVLFGRQVQEYVTAAGGDSLVQHQPALLVSETAKV